MVRATAVLLSAVAILAFPLSTGAAEAPMQGEAMQGRPEGMAQEDEASVLGLIQKEHRAVQEMLRELTQAREGKVDPDELRKQVEQLKEALLPHMVAEQKLFYPALKAQGEENLPVLEADEEHQMAQVLLIKIQNTPPDDPMFRVRLSILSDLLTNHIQEEEVILFGRARSEMNQEQLRQMREEFIALEEQVDPRRILQQAHQRELDALAQLTGKQVQ